MSHLPTSYLPNPVYLTLTSTEFRDDQRTELPEITGDLTGKTVILVGANISAHKLDGHEYPIPAATPINSRGLRFAAALKIASMNPGKLILTHRKDQEKSKKALDRESHLPNY